MGIVSLSHETILEVAWIPRFAARRARHTYYGHKAKKKSPCPSDKAEKSGNSGLALDGRYGIKRNNGA